MSLSMIKSKVTIATPVNDYGETHDLYSSLVYRLILSIDYRYHALDDGCNMVNNMCIDTLCRKITNITKC